MGRMKNGTRAPLIGLAAALATAILVPLGLIPNGRKDASHPFARSDYGMKEGDLGPAEGGKDDSKPVDFSLEESNKRINQGQVTSTNVFGGTYIKRRARERAARTSSSAGDGFTSSRQDRSPSETERLSQIRQKLEQTVSSPPKESPRKNRTSKIPDTSISSVSALSSDESASVSSSVSTGKESDTAEAGAKATSPFSPRQNSHQSKTKRVELVAKHFGREKSDTNKPPIAELHKDALQTVKKNDSAATGLVRGGKPRRSTRAEVVADEFDEVFKIPKETRNPATKKIIAKNVASVDQSSPKASVSQSSSQLKTTKPISQGTNPSTETKKSSSPDQLASSGDGTEEMNFDQAFNLMAQEAEKYEDNHLEDKRSEPSKVQSGVRKLQARSRKVAKTLAEEAQRYEVKKKKDKSTESENRQSSKKDPMESENIVASQPTSSSNTSLQSSSLASVSPLSESLEEESDYGVVKQDWSSPRTAKLHCATSVSHTVEMPPAIPDQNFDPADQDPIYAEIGEPSMPRSPNFSSREVTPELLYEILRGRAKCLSEHEIESKNMPMLIDKGGLATTTTRNVFLKLVLDKCYLASSNYGIMTKGIVKKDSHFEESLNGKVDQRYLSLMSGPLREKDKNKLLMQILARFFLIVNDENFSKGYSDMEKNEVIEPDDISEALKPKIAAPVSEKNEVTEPDDISETLKPKIAAPVSNFLNLLSMHREFFRNQTGSLKKLTDDPELKLLLAAIAKVVEVIVKVKDKRQFAQQVWKIKGDNLLKKKLVALAAVFEQELHDDGKLMNSDEYKRLLLLPDAQKTLVAKADTLFPKIQATLAKIAMTSVDNDAKLLESWTVADLAVVNYVVMRMHPDTTGCSCARYPAITQESLTDCVTTTAAQPSEPECSAPSHMKRPWENHSNSSDIKIDSALKVTSQIEADLVGRGLIVNSPSQGKSSEGENKEPGLSGATDDSRNAFEANTWGDEDSNDESEGVSSDVGDKVLFAESGQIMSSSKASSGSKRSLPIRQSIPGSFPRFTEGFYFDEWTKKIISELSSHIGEHGETSDTNCAKCDVFNLVTNMPVLPEGLELELSEVANKPVLPEGLELELSERQQLYNLLRTYNDHRDHSCKSCELKIVEMKSEATQQAMGFAASQGMMNPISYTLKRTPSVESVRSGFVGTVKYGLNTLKRNFPGSRSGSTTDLSTLEGDSLERIKNKLTRSASTVSLSRSLKDSKFGNFVRQGSMRATNFARKSVRRFGSAISLSGNQAGERNDHSGPELPSTYVRYSEHDVDDTDSRGADVMAKSVKSSQPISENALKSLLGMTNSSKKDSSEKQSSSKSGKTKKSHSKNSGDAKKEKKSGKDRKLKLTDISPPIPLANAAEITEEENAKILLALPPRTQVDVLGSSSVTVEPVKSTEIVPTHSGSAKTDKTAEKQKSATGGDHPTESVVEAQSSATGDSKKSLAGNGAKSPSSKGAFRYNARKSINKDETPNNGSFETNV